ncbi:MAG: CAP domain-containing protein [Candidatus Melainabacteria bacterium]|nr:CAP domain-containing protein [Candidatus Melainabacteria bacterium]
MKHRTRFIEICGRALLVLLPIVVFALPTSVFAAAKKSSANYDSMTLPQARLYMVQLINIDRSKNGLRPVALDPIASLAGQKHSDKLLALGAHSHWEPDGTKPPQRYNFVGGTDYVAENFAWYGASASPQKPDPKARFSRASIAGLESMWMHSDGHRKNILDKYRTHVGVGLSQSQFGISVVADQEFINKYGNISRIPYKAYRGTRVHVSGTLNSGYRVQCVSVTREDFPRRMSVSELNSTYSYGIGTEQIANYFPRDMSVSSSGFACAIEVKPEWRPGLYYCTIWAETGAGEKIPVSLLTFYVF